MAIHTENVRITGPGGTFDGYFAAPDGGPVPGMIVIQEIFGVNTHIRDVTNRVAEAGYAALAPALFWREAPELSLDYSPEEIEKALGLMVQVSLDKAVEDVGGAMELLGARPECRADRIGVMGFCWGGLLSFLVSCRLDPVCAVPYYGGRIAEFLGEVADMKNPALFHFGELDPRIPKEQVEQIRRAVTGKPGVEVHVYPDAEHGFNCDKRGSYHQPSAELAWRRTMDFLARHLG